MTSTKFTLTMACVVMSGSTVLFGCLQWIPASCFFTLSLVLRITGAIGDALFSTAALGYVATSFPSRSGTLLAGIETSMSVAGTVAPALGGILNEVGGFVTPFALVGFMTLTSGILVHILFEKNHNVTALTTNRHQRVEMLAPLRHIGVWINLIFHIVVTSVGAFNTATLTYYIYEVSPSISSSTVGLIFFARALMTVTACQLTGLAVDKISRPGIFPFAGLIFSAIGFVFCGPMWPVEIKPSIWLIVVSQLFAGVGFGICYISSLTLALREAYAAGLPNGESTNTVVMSLTISCCGIGQVVGAATGGALYEYYGYAISTTCLVAYISLTLLLLALVEGGRMMRRNSYQAILSEDQ